MTADDRVEITDVIAKAITAAIALHHLSCPIREVQTQQEINTRGVNNFRSFQLDVTGKMNFVHGAAKAWSWILGLAFTALIALCGWGFTQIYPAFRAIMVEYYIHHPDASLNKSAPKTSGELQSARNNQLGNINRPDMRPQPR